MAYQPYNDGQPPPYHANPYGQPEYGGGAAQYGQAVYGQQQPSYASPPPEGMQRQPQQQYYDQPTTVMLHGSADAEFAAPVQGSYAPQANYAPKYEADGTGESFVGAVPGDGSGGPHKRMEFEQVQAAANNGGYRDIGFLVAFVLHLVVMIILAGVHGPKLVRDMHDDPPAPTTGDEPRETSDGTMIGLLVVSAVIGVVFSIGWLSVMQRFADRIIHLCLLANVGLAVLGGILALAYGQILMGVVYLLMAGLMGLYYYFVRARIPFATAILHSSVQAIKENSGPVWVIYGLALVQIAWLALWAFIFTAVYHAAQRVVTEVDPVTGNVYQYRVNNSSGLQFLQAYCVLSLYWTCETLRGIGHVTTAGVVASWWFTPGSPAPTKSSLKRASTTSLGTICFAGLLVALVQTTRWVLQQARRDALREIVDCLLSWIERALKFFNFFALATCAIYGDDFMAGARRTGELFKAQLFTALINDDLSETVLLAGAFLSGICAGIVGAIWASVASIEGWVVCAVLSFIVGFLVALLSMGVIRSAVTTTFVAWAADPAVLAQNRPVEFQRIVDAAQPKYAGQGLAAYSGGQRV